MRSLLFPMRPSRFALSAVWFFFAAFSIARAQSIHWESSDSGDPSELQLVFEDCAPESDPDVPHTNGLTLTLAGTSTQTTINNFTLSRSTVLTYRARSQRSGPVQIPAFNVQTNKGTIRVPAFTGGSVRSAADLDLTARLNIGSASVWAGEVFPITYVLDAPRRNFSQLGSKIEWNSAPLVVEDWSNPELTEVTVKGEQRLNITNKARGYAKNPGPISLNATNQLVNVQTGSAGFGLFQVPRVDQLAVSSNRPDLLVKPLPPAPPGFNGAVGQLKLTSKIVPEKAAVGEPITWTLELSGTGNWPEISGLPQRDVSKDFKVVQPQAKRTPVDGKLFDVVLSEDVVLVPTREGSYTLGPVSFIYFDPASGTYQTLRTDRVTVTVTPPASVPTATTPATKEPATPGSNAATNPPPKFEDLKLKVPTTPSGIPREELPGSDRTLTPMSNRRVLALVATPFAALLLFWAWLAVRRAHTTDPHRAQRDARQRLAATLAQLRSETSASTGAQISPRTSELLLNWQHDSAALWQIEHAAPSADVFAPPPELEHEHDGGAALATIAEPRVASAAAADSPVQPEWSQLWSESDRALYSHDHGLPGDWVTRAEAALAAKRVTEFSPLRLFRPRNLFPFLFAAIVALAVGPQMLAVDAAEGRATDAATAYRNGDFATAEKIWSAALATDPTDSIIRYNLSLALAQEDRWAEAAAHASSAFVQNPSHPAIRWQLALACSKAGFVPGPIAAFLPAGPTEKLAQLWSPGGWQLALVVASTLAAIALGLFLVCGYRRGFGWRGWIASAGFAAGVLLALASVVALETYGSTAKQNAVVVWRTGVLRSIPTEADNTQKTTPLPAGSLALAGKTVLGWRQLTFDNGQTGWVRREELVPLWSSPAAFK